METRRWQEEGRKTKEDMARHTEGGSGHTGRWLEIVMTRKILLTTVPDGDNSLPNVLIRTGETKSKKLTK